MNRNPKPNYTRRHEFPFFYTAYRLRAHTYILGTTTLRELVGALRGMSYNPGGLCIHAMVMTELGSAAVWVPDSCYSTRTGGVTQWLDPADVKEYDAAKVIYTCHRRQPFSVGYTAYPIGEGRGCPVAVLPSLRELVEHLQNTGYGPWQV